MKKCHPSCLMNGDPPRCRDNKSQGLYGCHTEYDTLDFALQIKGVHRLRFSVSAFHSGMDLLYGRTIPRVK